jgi:hypothetical protein
MRRAVAIWFALLLGPAFLTAQTLDPSQPQKPAPQPSFAPPQTHFQVLDLGRLPSSGCPVALSARQSGSGSLISVKPGQPESGHDPEFSQRIHLTAANSAASHVTGATVRVHGLTPRPRMLPVDTLAQGPAHISRTLDVNFSPEARNASAADLTLRGFTAVLSIDVVSLTYADGSTWRSGEGACRILPDPAMLIGAR